MWAVCAGWLCAKTDEVLRMSIDLRADTMTARGDNCDGWTA